MYLIKSVLGRYYLHHCCTVIVTFVINHGNQFERKKQTHGNTIWTGAASLAEACCATLECSSMVGRTHCFFHHLPWCWQLQFLPPTIGCPQLAPMGLKEQDDPCNVDRNSLKKEPFLALGQIIWHASRNETLAYKYIKQGEKAQRMERVYLSLNWA